jgi:hypothetical protein
VSGVHTFSRWGECVLACEIREVDMPPRGVKSARRTRQYEKIKASAKKRGRSTATAKRIAAATVNKQRSQAGETRSGRKSGRSRKSSSASSRKTSRRRTGRSSGSRKRSSRR